MYIPGETRERVRVAGRAEVFFVLAIDADSNTADLIPLNGLAYVEERVPFTKLFPYDEERQLEQA